jgi:hypothetical protein
LPVNSLNRRIGKSKARLSQTVLVQNTNSQYNLPEFGKKIAYKANRDGVSEHFTDPSVSMSIKTDVELIDHYDQLLNKLELYILQNARHHDPNALYLRRSRAHLVS